mmetsp:Transcript_20678/g.65027  ORF Transcript_20678/g.65027 Transcript_20678/m.65027 type:complete len:426 (-) Transcript_20678:121-1398(-)
MACVEGNDRFIPCRSSSLIEEGVAFGEARSRCGGGAHDRLLREELLGERAAGRARLRFSPPRKGVASRRKRSGENAAPEFAYKAPRDGSRRVATSPFKVIEAPSLADDFYLDVVDWSSSDVLAVGLGSTVYLWSACTSRVAALCDLGDDAVASVKWTHGGARLAIGSRSGDVSVWDAARRVVVRDSPGHASRVGCLDWRGDVLASGSRDKTVCLQDLREKAASSFKAHRQEVCGLKWAPHGDHYLATGGNDNKLLVFDARALPTTAHRRPVCKFVDHTAAVKAVAWSPHHRGLLVSGAGTADRTIKFRDALTGANLDSIDTGSQVCSLAFAQTANALVSTGGFSLNQICLWRFDNQHKKTTPTNYATLTGHTHRVLYLAMSPDGSSIVTGAGDETLRFWHCFPASGHRTRAHDSLLSSPAAAVLR